MFGHLGDFVIRRWRPLFLLWLLISLFANGVLTGWFNRVAQTRIPNWEAVAKTGEFQFLPQNMPSLQASRIFNEAFPNDLLASSAVLVLNRSDSKISEADKEFIDKVLIPEIEAVHQETSQGKDPVSIGEIRTYSDSKIGDLLISQDQKSTLVVVNLATEFLEAKNRPFINGLEKLLDTKAGRLKGKVPAGLVLSLSGSATVGRDMLVAQLESAHNTERWTVGLVILLLLAIYRAPLLALIPLISVFIAVQISLMVIILLKAYTNLGIDPFSGLQTYITVVTYGAGVDYCLFLIARYKEELDRGANTRDALIITLDKIGAALAASAATVSVGIGMMYFAQFGKFQQAGLCMALSLLIMLVVSLSFTPALLLLVGKAAFWPYGRTQHLSQTAGVISGASFFAKWLERLQLHNIWDWTSDQILRMPLRIWLAFILIMAPFAGIGVYYHGYMSYGLLSELPRTKSSVIGSKAVQKHFPAGSTAPITVLIRDDQLDFDTLDAQQALEDLTLKLKDRCDELRIADIRSVSHPTGLNSTKRGFQKVLRGGAARKYYIAQEGKLATHVTRLDIVLKDDPFSRDSLQQLDRLEEEVRWMLSSKNPENQPAKAAPMDAAGDKPESGKKEEEDEVDSSLALLSKAEVFVVGTTANIRDLKKVTDHDQIVIDALVLLTVYVILVLLLRTPAICAYLLVSVFFSYFVSLGITFAVFWGMDPQNFAGLDWKVPIFLFTILIAVGEDYNIFLMARIEEEQREFGPVQGVKIAMVQTGSIISSCGIIMAGTFFSLVIAGTLAGMQQLGFALTVGVLLDTFIVRPILVPAYLILLNSGRWGRVGRWLGGLAPVPPNPPSTNP